jgi:hypothetical protein
MIKSNLKELEDQIEVKSKMKGKDKDLEDVAGMIT